MRHLVALHPAAPEAIRDFAIVGRRQEIFDELRDFCVASRRLIDREIDRAARDRGELVVDDARRPEHDGFFRNERLLTRDLVHAVGHDPEPDRRRTGFAKGLGEEQQAVETPVLVAADGREIRHRIGLPGDAPAMRDHGRHPVRRAKALNECRVVGARSRRERELVLGHLRKAGPLTHSNDGVAVANQPGRDTFTGARLVHEHETRFTRLRLGRADDRWPRAGIASRTAPGTRSRMDARPARARAWSVCGCTCRD